MNRDLDTLNLIREAAAALIQHLNGCDQALFRAQRLVRSAVLYELVVIGEGVKRLSPELRIKHGAVPWKQIAGMRDRVVHSFDELEVTLVWGVCQEGIPSLIEAIDEIFAQESEA
jgi:uncharacterized protein with HEPN domain